MYLTKPPNVAVFEEIHLPVPHPLGRPRLLGAVERFDTTSPYIIAVTLATFHPEYFGLKAIPIPHLLAHPKTHSHGYDTKKPRRNGPKPLHGTVPYVS